MLTLLLFFFNCPSFDLLSNVNSRAIHMPRKSPRTFLILFLQPWGRRHLPPGVRHPAPADPRRWGRQRDHRGGQLDRARRAGHLLLLRGQWERIPALKPSRGPSGTWMNILSRDEWLVDALMRPNGRSIYWRFKSLSRGQIILNKDRVLQSLPKP